MSHRARRLRLRPGHLARHRFGLWTENLESRHLMVAPPLDVAAGLTIATGLPLPGLAIGQGLATRAQSLPATTVSVAPASLATPSATLVVPVATGPATTLVPLMNDAETANATASEVARPTPGRSDRISVILQAPEVVPITHLRVPGGKPIEVIPGPEIEVVPLAPVPLLAVATAPSAPLPQVEVALPPLPEPPMSIPVAPAASIALQVWDAAIERIAADLGVTVPADLTLPSESGLAGVVVLAAWGGYQFRRRAARRVTPTPRAVAAVEGDGALG